MNSADVVLIDMGNTRLKWARYAHGQLGAVSSAASDDAAASGLLAAGQAVPGAVWLSAVAGERAVARLQAGISAAWGVPVHRVGPCDPLPGVRNGYRHPDQLGVDRLLAMVAARARAAGAACVVDCGTAITLDFVAGDGAHLGGFILPGLRMMREALLESTAIPRAAGVTAGEVLGRDTPTAVATGTRHAVVSLVEQFVNGPRSPRPAERFELFVGGGDAQTVLDLLTIPATCIDHLVLDGLRRVADAAGGGN